MFVKRSVSNGASYFSICEKEPGGKEGGKTKVLLQVGGRQKFDAFCRMVQKAESRMRSLGGIEADEDGVVLAREQEALDAWMGSTVVEPRHVAEAEASMKLAGLQVSSKPKSRKSKPF